MPPAGWFIDADVLGLYRVLYHARRKSFDDVYSGLTDGFPVEVGMLDPEWMSLLKSRDLAVIIKDGRHRFRAAEREAIVVNGLGEFALRSSSSLNNWEIARLVLARWDELDVLHVLAVA
ncbi:MAG: hypothetical protein ACRDYA_19355 [Egibacteraceae bacterium]